MSLIYLAGPLSRGNKIISELASFCLCLWPEGIESPQNFVNFVKTCDKKILDKCNLPRLSIFSGEEGKGEVGYQTWKYEMFCSRRQICRGLDTDGYMEIS